MKKKSRTLGNGFQRLEDRQLMAGNVWVGHEAGALVIRGDNAANAVSITEYATNKFRVEGVSTTINGAKSPLNINSTSESLIIDLKGGNDSLSVFGVTMKKLNLSAGAGADNVKLDFVTTTSILDAALIRLGTEAEAENDSLFVGHSNLVGGMQLQAGGGNDTARISVSTLGKSSIVEMGAGNDYLSFEGGVKSDRIYATLGAGNDTLFVDTAALNFLYADGGAGTDTFYRGRYAQIKQVQLVSIERQAVV